MNEIEGARRKIGLALWNEGFSMKLSPEGYIICIGDTAYNVVITKKE